MSIFNFFRKQKPVSDQVRFTDEKVTRTMPNGNEETVRWDDLHEVGIITTDEGPWSEDAYFVLIASGGKSGCAVPLSSEGSQQLLERLQELPGFDNETFANAMSSTSNKKFICWKRQSE